MNIEFLREIKKLRQDLHKIPELSFAEEKTKKHLIDWLCENTDFGYYLQLTEGAFLGIGSGGDHAPLHTRDYEFPDEIIETALAIYKNILGSDGRYGK